MSTKLALVAYLTFASLIACTAETQAPASTTQDGLTGQKDDVGTPTVCAHADEESCLADEGCAWGDQGKGHECFYVGRIDAQPGDSRFPLPPSGSDPTVCTHHASEAACLTDEGCAWGDQGKGHECFYVGPIDAQPGDPRFFPPPSGSDPTAPTVCTHHASEAACLTDEGCAWGDQGKGHECFYVGPVEAYGK